MNLTPVGRRLIAAAIGAVFALLVATHVISIGLVPAVLILAVYGFVIALL